MAVNETVQVIRELSASIEVEARAARLAAQRGNVKLSDSCKARALEALEALKRVTLTMFEKGLGEEVGAELKRQGYGA